MINELFLYDRDTGLFRKLVDQIAAIHTYHISPNYGHDLNTNNLEQYLKDPAFGMSAVTQKYPICVCVTPRSRPTRINGARWEQFFFTVYFLQRTGVDGQNKIKSLDKDTNQSAHHVWYDWAEMKTAAIQFIDLFELTIKGDVVVNSETIKFRRILNVDFDKMDIRRLSNFNNDKISGVELNFACYLDISECTLVVGDIEYLVSTTLPEVDPIWEEEKGNYYTKTEVDNILTTEENDEGIIITSIAGQNLSSGRVVYISNGEAFYFDPSDELLAGRTVGLTKNAALSGGNVKVQLDGVYELSGFGLTPDVQYFIGSNGALTTNTSLLKIIQQAGVSISSDKLAIHFYSPIITI